MSGWTRSLSINLTGALIIGLSVGLLMSASGGPPFRELFLLSFLGAFVPYVLAALLALRFAAQLAARGVADYVFVPLLGSFLSLAFFYQSVVGFTLPPWEAAPTVIVLSAVYFLTYAVSGVLALLVLRSILLSFGKTSSSSSFVSW